MAEGKSHVDIFVLLARGIGTYLYSQRASPCPRINRVSIRVDLCWLVSVIAPGVQTACSPFSVLLRTVTSSMASGVELLLPPFNILKRRDNWRLAFLKVDRQRCPFSSIVKNQGASLSALKLEWQHFRDRNSISLVLI